MNDLIDYREPDISANRAGELRTLIETFNAEYCAALDTNQVERWPEFFTEHATYRVTSRENAMLNMPVGLIYSEGQAMIRDRATACARSQMFAPRHMLHVLGTTRVLQEQGDSIDAQTPFILMQTLVEGPSTIHLAGTYHDRFSRSGDRLLIAKREVVYDTEILATALAYPV